MMSAAVRPTSWRETRSVSLRWSSLAALLALAACAPRPEPPATPLAVERPASFEAWKASFRAEAIAGGILPGVVDLAFDGVQLNESVLQADRRQPELTQTVWAYLGGAVSDSRIRRGRQQLARNRALLEAVERQYGVPLEILVAIWGMETDYGASFGGFDVVEALATLAYDSRRPDFARRELIAALSILQNGDVALGGLQGSWAGAMGHTQFIPTTYLTRAVDHDGDGRRDLWNSLPDVFASTANYLIEAGWTPGEPWGEEVVLPDDFDWRLADLDARRADTARPMAVWRAMGIRRTDGRPPGPSDRLAALLLPAGHSGPAFLVQSNFRAILHYNNSTKYALAVGHLSDRLTGGGPFRGLWPVEEPAFTVAENRELQRLLADLGYQAGPIDGIVGPLTRTAVRGFQRDVGRPADGFPTQALMDQIRRTHAVLRRQSKPAAAGPG